MTSKCCLGNNISVGANSLVNKSFSEDNLLLVGSPALIKRNRSAWYLVEDGVFKDRVESIENLRKELNL